MPQLPLATPDPVSLCCGDADWEASVVDMPPRSRSSSVGSLDISLRSASLRMASPLLMPALPEASVRALANSAYVSTPPHVALKREYIDLMTCCSTGPVEVADRTVGLMGREK